jgi:hypothetical protein
MGIKTGSDLTSIEKKFLFYPCSGNDITIPVKTFMDFVSTFWFVDKYYYRGDYNLIQLIRPIIIHGMKHLRSEFSGSDLVNMDSKKINADSTYDYLEPGYRTDIYEYKSRIIKINIRRGFGYNSLFGPTTLPINRNNLGVFFYRGDSFEGGSRQTWMSSQPVRMLRGQEKVPLLQRIIEALPDKGILATDGSNHDFPGCRSNYPFDEDYKELVKYNRNKDISCNEAVKKANDFTDRKGNLFNCIGDAGMSYGPTLIWQIHKPNKS